MFFKKKNKHNAIDLNNLPTHVGFIMDGNRRWARKRGLPTLAGHKEGAEALKRIVRRASEICLKNLSFFCFSIENFKRSEEEVNYLLKMIGEIEKLVPDMLKIDYKFHHSGDKSLLPPETVECISRIEKATENCKTGTLNFLIAYGGRHDLVMATKAMIKANVDPETITEESIKEYLTTATLPDVDLVVRTSGEQRISGFMLYNCAYAEMIFDEKYWPDYKGADLDRVIAIYQNRERRFGR